MAHSNYFTNRQSYLTLRWIYGNDREQEFLNCHSIDEIKAFIWKYMQPLFNEPVRKISHYRNIKVVEVTTAETIDQKPKKNIEAEPVYDVIPVEKSLESFKKGMALVHFPALLEYIQERNAESMKTFVNQLLTDFINKKELFFSEDNYL